MTPKPLTELELRRSMRAELYGGRYRLLERLGVGGMATVFHARDERLGRDVAVKVIARHLRQDDVALFCFRREAKLGARLSHPNIVAVLGAGVDPHDFIVMELVRGLDAGALLRKAGRQTLEQVVHLLPQVCEGLQHAHDNGLIHRDVSPGNVLIGQPGGTTKLADFGLACDVRDVSVDRPGHATGTPGYIAPELLAGCAPSRRSDLYSVAAVAHALLSGQAFTRAPDPSGTVPLATAVCRPAPLARIRPDLPPAVTEAIDQGLSPDPDSRQASVAEFHDQLVEDRAPLVQLPVAA